MMQEAIAPEGAEAPDLNAIVAELVATSRLPQRTLMARTGLSKDQLSRTLRGTRPIEMSGAMIILRAADLPARGAMTLALYDRPDLAVEWSQSGLAAFLETLIEALPNALAAEVGEATERINPRWGQHAARFVAQRLAHHIRELVEREERLGEFEPMRSTRSA